MSKLIWADTACNITLAQGDDSLFTVRYDNTIITGLTDEQAAEEIGACILHSLACNGHIED